MATLYQLTGDLLLLQQMIEDGADGLEDTLESIQLAVEDKLEGYAMVIKNVQSDVDGLDAEIKRLTERKKVMQNNIDRMKKAVADTLLTVEGNRMKTEKFTFSFRKSSQVQIEDETLIPPQFIKTETKVVKADLAKLLKEGAEIPGAKLIQNQSLSIK